MNNRKIIAFVLSLAILCPTGSMIAQSSNNDSVIATSATTSESNADDFYYISSDGSITITGYSGTDTNVVIPTEIDGVKVTAISNGAFSRCTKLTSITIPDSVTSIGHGTFSDCTGLTSITIPDSVTSIGDIAFSNCTELTSINLPENLTSIGTGTFSNCTKLTSITIPDSVTSIGTGAFSSCTELTSITLSENLTSIGGSAFGGCSKLTSIILPENLTSIESSAFNGCKKLSSINLPKNLTSIGNYAFLGCIELTSITIPDSVTSIGNEVFLGCNSLNTVYLCNSNIDTSNLEISSDGTLPQSIFTFDEDTGTITGYTGSATKIVIPSEINGVKVTAIGDIAFKDNTSITSVVIPDSVTSIGDGAFYGCTGLTSITLPENLTSIGDGAFWSCTGLTSITLPENLTSIGDYAFSNCISLTNITLPENLTSIGNGTLSNCQKLTSITLPKNLTYIGISAFYRCKALNTVYLCNSNIDTSNLKISDDGTLPQSIFTFDETTGTITKYTGTATEIVIPSEINGVKVTAIGESAFWNCTGLTSINLPENLTSIGDYAFRDCIRLTSITIPNSVTSIGDGAFCGCAGLTSINLPENLTSIGDYAFDNCAGLTSITIPNSVTSIGKSAFDNCTVLTSITLPENLTSIGDSTFAWCTGLTSITLPENLTSIGGYAFAMTKLANITIPKNVTGIGEDAFIYCDNLQTIIVNKLKADCTEFGLPEETDTLKIYYNVKVTYTLDNITSSNKADETSSYDDYTTTLTVDKGYNLPTNITVKVGDTVLEDGYTFENGVLTIPKESLTDNVIIEADAIPNEYKVTSNLENIKTNGAEVASHGKEYKATLTADDGYTLPNDITIKVGDTVLKDGYTFKDGVLTISGEKVTSDITIEATGKLKEYSVTSDLTNIKSNGSDKISHGKEYKATLTANDGYTLPNDITIKVGDTVLKDGYTFKDGVLTISADKVTGNITITATATAITDNKSLDLLRLKKHVLGISEIEDITSLDSNNDGTLNIVDIVALKNKIINQ